MLERVSRKILGNTHLRSLTCRAVFARLDDTIGVLDCLAMKSLLARWRHDESSALQSDALYSQVFTTKDTEPV